MRLFNKGKYGFTILEVLVGMIVLGISFLGILMLFSKAVIFIADVQANDLVVDMLEEEIESIRSMPFADIVTGTPTFAPTGLNQLINPAPTVVIDNPYSGIFPYTNRIVRVTVTIAWDSPSGQRLNRSLVTYISDLGISS